MNTEYRIEVDNEAFVAALSNNKLCIMCNGQIVKIPLSKAEDIAYAVLNMHERLEAKE